MYCNQENFQCKDQHFKRPIHSEKANLEPFQYRSQNKADWKTMERKIHEKIAQINEQRRALLQISQRMNESYFICGQKSNFPLIFSEIQSEINQSLSQIAEKIHQFQNNVEQKMKDIQTLVNSYSFFHNEKNNLSISFDLNANQISLPNRYQGIQKIKQKILKLQKQLVQTKENQRKLIFMIQGLSLYEKDCSKNQYQTEKNSLQFKNLDKTLIRHDILSINPECNNKRSINSNKALQFKNAISNAKNIKHQKVKTIFQKDMNSLNQLVISESQSINSSQTLADQNPKDRKSQNQINSIDQKVLRKVFNSKNKEYQNKHIYQSHQQIQNNLKRNSSQSNIKIQQRFQSNKQLFHGLSCFQKNDNSKQKQRPRKNSHKFFEFNRSQLSIDNKNHRETFLVNNLMK